MVIKTIHVRNFRCIHDEVLACGALTALVGANGAGKSTFLLALKLFHDTNPALSEEDFCHDRVGDEIEITATYENLSFAARTKFGKYIQNDELSVTRVLRLVEGVTVSSYHGSSNRCAEFLPIRAAAATPAKAAYQALQQQTQFADLPGWKNKGEALSAMDQWEVDHPALCTPGRDDGQFFGFKGVAAGYLGQYTKFIFVPAVRDVSSDAEEGKNSLFTELIDLVIRSTEAGDAELKQLGEEMTERYRTIVEGAKGAELRRIQGELSTELSRLVPGVDVNLDWQPINDLALPAPKAIAKINEDGVASSVERKGHGLQRAFLIMMLQYLEAVRSSRRAPDQTPAAEGTVLNVVIAIEEPELYQHPDRQRHFASVLFDLAKILAPDQSSTQVLYTTHSPHFVGLDRFDSIRRAKKVCGSSAVIPTTLLSSATLASIASQLGSFSGADATTYTGPRLRARLASLMTPWMNEGFFAEVVVLVEGEQDRAALVAAASLLGHNVDSMGIAIIPCFGKSSIDRPALIFRAFGISTYIIWDSDEGNDDPHVDTNRRLLRISGKPEADYPDLVEADCACFKTKLEDVVEREIGSTVFSELVDELQSEYEMRKKDVLKNPVVMSKLLTRANDRGVSSLTLGSIVQRIIALRG